MITLSAPAKTGNVYKNRTFNYQCRTPIGHKLSNALTMAFLGVIAGSIYGFVMKSSVDVPLEYVMIASILIGFFLGLCLGIIEEFILHDKFKRKPLYSLLIIRTVIYAITAFTFLVIIISFSMAFANDLSFHQGVAEYLSHEIFKIDLLFSVLVGFCINFILQINKFFGPGIFFKLLSGKYHTPREEERIFMFVDIKGSTGLAEKLGDLKFSLLLQDFFYDVNQAIAVSRGEIYQYVGDEVVISWPLSKVNFENNCLECFYIMENVIWNKRNHYLNHYQVVPQFKAGIHYGKVIAAWVGDLKKEIVYHGDVLNTTARILTQCNELEQNLLVSEELYQMMQIPEDVKTFFYPDISLKGKREPVNLVGFNV